jgi:hypothetical protein
MQAPQPHDNSQDEPGKPVEQIHVHGKNQMFVGGNIIGNGNHIQLGDFYAPQPLQVQYSLEQSPGWRWVERINIPTVEKYTFGTLLGVCASVLGILGFFGVSGQNFLMPSPLTPLLPPCIIVGSFAFSFWAMFHSLRKGTSLTPFGNWKIQADAR